MFVTVNKPPYVLRTAAETCPDLFRRKSRLVNMRIKRLRRASWRSRPRVARAEPLPPFSLAPTEQANILRRLLDADVFLLHFRLPVQSDRRRLSQTEMDRANH